METVKTKAEIDMVCDGCVSEIKTGDTIYYSQADGKVLCEKCGG
ncbi:MAG: hypothetical protein OEY56_10270 [Cyclobacteriaceae bacterium]|nr:hypothetical protein [Cyclobacteriaceae bacterium]